MEYSVLLTDGSRYVVESPSVENIKATAVPQLGKSPLVEIEVRKKKKSALVTINVNQVVAIIEDAPIAVADSKAPKAAKVPKPPKASKD
jgi:hypothetical protein